MKKAICIGLTVIMIIIAFFGPLATPAKAFAASVAVIGAVIAVMALSGIAITASGMTSAQLKNYIGDKLDEFAAYKGDTIDHLINSAGIGMTISGLMQIESVAAAGINEFIGWFVANESLQNNSVVRLQENGKAINDLPMFQLPVQIGAYKWQISNNPGAVVYMYFMEDQSHALTWYCMGPTRESILFYINNSLEYAGYMNRTAPNGWYYNYYYAGIQGVDLTVPTDVIHPYTPDQIATGQVDVGSAGYIDANTGIITIPTINTGDKYFIDLNGVLPGDTTIEAADKIIDNVITGVIPVIEGDVAEEEPEYVITGPVAVSGLKDVFPFCIPFDLYNLLEVLAADPEAPSFDWRFYFPGICDETYTIDLAAFNTVAQILRTLELLLFCVGLAFETRKLIRS